MDPLGGEMRQDEGKGRREIQIKKAISKNMTKNLEAGIARQGWKKENDSRKNEQ